MPNGLSRDEIRSFATMGATRRLAEIQEEIAGIVKAFPELTAPEPKQRKMSTAQRKLVGERMKKYWAERRATSKPPDVGHRYPKKRPRLLDKNGRVVAGT